MSVRRLAAVQPADFAFTQDNLHWAEGQIAKYPAGRQASAVIPLLWKAQEQHHGWLPEPAIRRVAEMLGMPVIRVMEVATFYTMFNLEPVGEHFVQLCGTTPCMLRGANELKDVCRKVIGEQRHVTSDGKLSWLEVECLGACANAPMVQINFDYYEDLDPESFEKLLGDLRAGRAVKPGSQTGRSCSAPADGDTTLTDPSLYDGSRVGAWRKKFEGEAAEPAVADPKPAAADSTPAPAAPAAAKSAERSADRSRREGNSFPYASLPAAPAAPNPPAAGKPAEASRPEAKAAASARDAESQPKSAAAPGSAGPKPSPSLEAAASKPGGVPAAIAHPKDVAPGVGGPISDAHKPDLLKGPRGGKGDDLKMIWGVGPKLEAMLHSMGVFHFDQIAAWTDENLAWVDQNLGSFKGRAVREQWIVQGKVLAEGGSEQDAEDAARRARGEAI